MRILESFKELLMGGNPLSWFLLLFVVLGLASRHDVLIGRRGPALDARRLKCRRPLIRSGGGQGRRHERDGQ